MLPVNRQVIFIGGPSQSGKSTLSEKLAEQFGAVWYDLDLDPWVRFLLKHSPARFSLRLVQLRCCYIIATTKGFCIIDCPYLSPDAITRLARHRTDLIPVFLGYPDADIAKLMAHLASLDFKNAAHLKKLDDPRLERALMRYRAICQRQQKRCAALDIPYFDMSDLDQLTQAQAQAVDLITVKIANAG
jgi:2-phosphoglycerate kinase